MTCIAAIEYRYRVHMAGDSAVSWGDSTYSTAAPKVVKRGGVVLGAAGDAKACDLAVRADWPRYDGEEPSGWVSTVLWPVLALCARRSSELELIVGVGGHLYLLDGSGAVMRPRHGYAAVGSGQDAAMGALYALHTGQPRRRLRTALEAAAAARSDVAPPWRFVVA